MEERLNREEVQSERLTPLQHKQKSRFFSGSVFLLASAFLLILLLLQISDYYRDQEYRETTRQGIAHAWSQLSRTSQAAYAVNADSILYLTPVREEAQGERILPSCGTPRACLEAGVRRLDHEMAGGRNFTNLSPALLIKWRESRTALQAWRDYLLGLKTSDRERNIDKARFRSASLFEAALLHLHSAQENLTSYDEQVRSRLRQMNEAQLTRVFSLECLCVGLMLLSAWHMLRVGDLKNKNRQTEKQLSIAVDAIDHRVRNMIQVIDSLIQIQMEEDDPARQRQVLEGIASDIRAIATVHSFQCSPNTVDALPVELLLTQLVTQRMPGAQIDMELSPVELPVRKTTSFVLIVNELLTFALQHQTPLTRLQLAQRNSDAIFLLSFGELSEHFTRPETSLLLLETLVRHDLRGSICYGSHPPQVQIVFPLED